VPQRRHQIHHQQTEAGVTHAQLIGSWRKVKSEVSPPGGESLEVRDHGTARASRGDFFSASEVFKTAARDLNSVSRIKSTAAYLPSPPTAGFIFSPRAGSERLDPFDPARNLLVGFESFGRIVEMLNRYESPERDFVFSLCCCLNTAHRRVEIFQSYQSSGVKKIAAKFGGWG
jgi:hypothetical protein